ncbi:MAG: polymer-forming cytoskeletal protein, partial [Acidobacteriota bacterium]
EELGVRTIEVSGDTIAVNGERVSEGVLRAWLGEQAEPVVRLHRLRPAERQSLFGLKPATAATGETEIPDTGTAESAAPADSDAAAAETPVTSEEPEATEAGGTPAAPEAPEAPEEPEPPSSSTGSRVKIIGKIVVDKDEMVEEAVAVLGSVRVDGEVAEDVVAVGGSVVINGKVGGSVVSVGRDVRLGPHAEVMGDVTSVGGTILREEGSKVHGSTQDVGIGGNRDWHRDIDIDTGFPFFGLLWSLLWLIVLALLIFLCLMIARNRVERAESYIATEPWKAAVVGLLAMFLFLPLLLVVTVLLVITIVGCALILLYPFIAVFLALLLLVGYTASVHR